jgi:uncharacterized protein
MSYSPITSFGDEPDIAYPAPWQFRLIGPEESDMRRAVDDVLGGRQHRISTGNRSRTGRYCSLELALVVESRDDRHELFERLRRNPAFVYIL